MRKIFLIVSAMSIVFVSNAYAGGYGAAGCGLGALIFEDDNSMVSQIIASTLNGIGVQTSAISCSHSSHCETSGLVLASWEQEAFVEKNYDTITREMAAGSGEHLNTLAGLMGYGFETFAQQTKFHYDTIFRSESTSPGEMLQAIRVVMADANS